MSYSHWRCPQPLSSVCETLCLNFAHLGGLDNGYGRGALWVAQRQAPLPGEGLGELGRRLLAKARAGG